MRKISFYLFSIFLFCFSSYSIATDTPVIAAASSVKFALQEIANAFYQDTGKNIRISYGSSGNLTRQIQQGAPFELFLSANAQYVQQLHQQHKTLDQGVVYALGHLVILTQKNSSLILDEQLVGIKKAIQTDQIQHFAIANPIHAPYGTASQQVLQHLGLWKPTKPYLVLGENIAHAAQFINAGAAQVGLISYSLALAPALKKNTRSLLIPSNFHHPLKQTMVLLKNAGATSKLFFIYLQQDKARNILAYYGYSTP